MSGRGGRRGIILAGGSGTRLYPVTKAVNKHLLPVYDKPMVYYPLCALMMADVRDFLIIANPTDLPLYERLLGLGEPWGVRIEYAAQPAPRGLADAFIVGRRFVEGYPSALILGDNIFYGSELRRILTRAAAQDGATIFAYRVDDPRGYGVLKFDATGTLVDLVEKPADPPSNYAVTGLYFYDEAVADIAASLRPSTRGELEITAVNAHYLRMGRLRVEVLGRGVAWLDAGTHDTLLQAGQFIATIEQRQGLKIACPEEVAFRLGYIGEGDLERLAGEHGDSDYGTYLRAILQESRHADAGVRESGLWVR